MALPSSSPSPSPTPEPSPGPTNTLVDVAGLRVGHCTLDAEGWRTGVTVVVTPPGGCTAGVDVRGGGPGTRETDLLDPRNLVDRIDAVVLAGGSAFGLRAADGVLDALADDDRGWVIESSSGTGRVPIVPAAILFDLGRGGDWRNHPRAEHGAQAYWAASTDAVELGAVGAGTGALAGALRGGIGSASVVLPGLGTVAALVAVNCVGSPADPNSGRLYAAAHAFPGELPEHVPLPAPAALPTTAGTATTLAVVATDVTLSTAQCQKMAGVAHDGMARAIVPVHTLFDGDTVFALSTGAEPGPGALGLVEVMEAAARCLARAIGRAVTSPSAGH